MSSKDLVRTGSWTNWTKGRVLGATITMTPRDAAFLVAFFALFVRLVGSNLWGIWCYLIHQWRARRGMRDALHHQQQVLLRNSHSVGKTLWMWWTLGWAWRSKANNPIPRSLALILVAILQIIAFVTAGIFSSNITLTDSAVLASSENCGSWPLEYEYRESSTTTVDTLREQTAYGINARKEMTQALAYVGSCYQDRTSCPGYIKTALSSNADYAVDKNASCPFDKSLCLSDAVSIDTGFLDSAVDLGINAKPQDRILYRRTTSCAVLSTRNRKKSIIDPHDRGTATPYNNITYFYYGRDNFSDTEYTYESSNYTTNAMYNFWYDVTTASSLKKYFKPDPEFQADRADVDIIFLANKMKYQQPVNDPWFSAHQKEESDDDEGFFLYTAVNNPTPLGCKSQHQFCDPTVRGEKRCTPLASWDQTFDSYVDQYESLSNLQYGALYRILHAAYQSSYDQITLALDTEALLATQAVAENEAIGLTPDQWKDEVVNFNNIMLAYVQSLMVSYVTGPVVPWTEEYIIKPNETWQFLACENQIITQPDYLCFSTLGIALILAIGLLIIITNLSLPSLVRYLRRKNFNATTAYKQLEWDLTEAVQLQRLVYEGQGTGTWNGEPGEIPTTAKEDRLGIPEWTGQGIAKRVSRDHLSFYGNKAESPLMTKGGESSDVKEVSYER